MLNNEKLNEIVTAHNIVYEILFNDESLNDSDMNLYFEYVKRQITKKGSTFNSRLFVKAFIDSDFRKKYKIVAYETISRTRRKIHSEHPELKNSIEVEKERKENIDAYINYSKK